MFTLLDALDNSKEINFNAYFIISYNEIPSHLGFRTPIKESKETMENIISCFDVRKYKLKEVYKIWTTEDDKDSDTSNDYPYEYLGSAEKPLLNTESPYHT